MYVHTIYIFLFKSLCVLIPKFLCNDDDLY